MVGGDFSEGLGTGGSSCQIGHPTMEDYLGYLELRGRQSTASRTRLVLRQYLRWLDASRLDPMAITTADFERYLLHLTEHRCGDGHRMQRSSVGSQVVQLKAYYRWLEARGLIVVDPVRRVRFQVHQSRQVVREHLSFQEATALVQTQAAHLTAMPRGSHAWALAARDLAMLVVALATGRRRAGIRRLRVEQVDLVRRELRVDHEKGVCGRVLPVAGWAIEVLEFYLAHARPLLVKDPQTPWLFVDRTGSQPVSEAILWSAMQAMIQRTVAANPDLGELPQKTITWHSLRVSFATLLFQNGCDIRSINELMLHRRLSTTARYTPIPVEDLRQVCRTAHPRA